MHCLLKVADIGTLIAKFATVWITVNKKMQLKTNKETTSSLHPPSHCIVIDWSLNCGGYYLSEQLFALLQLRCKVDYSAAL